MIRPKAHDELDRVNRSAFAADGSLTLRSLLETREKDPAALAGLHTAAAYLTRRGVVESCARIRRHADRLRSLIAGVPQLSLYASGGLTGIVCIRTTSDHATRELAETLGHLGLEVALVDRVRAPLDTAAGLLIRISPHYYNTDNEIARTAELLTTVVMGGRP